MKISRGVLSGMISRTARKLNGAYEDIGSKLSEQGHLYADETGWRVNGNNYWLWSFSNKETSFYKSDRGRHNQEVLMTMARTAQKQGVSFTDTTADYLTQPKE